MFLLPRLFKFSRHGSWLFCIARFNHQNLSSKSCFCRFGSSFTYVVNDNQSCQCSAWSCWRMCVTLGRGFVVSLSLSYAQCARRVLLLSADPDVELSASAFYLCSFQQSGNFQNGSDLTTDPNSLDFLMENMRRKDQQLLEMNRENEMLKIKVQLLRAHK